MRRTEGKQRYSPHLVETGCTVTNNQDHAMMTAMLTVRTSRLARANMTFER
jgi:hypothetical protein